MADSEDVAVFDPVVLVADDDQATRMMMKESLNRVGIDRVAMVTSGKETIRMAKKLLPDLIILDIQMPELNGFQTCAFLKNAMLSKDIPIMVVSDLADIKDKSLAYSCGADDFLAKPLDRITLVARCKAILETQRLREQVFRLTDSKAINDCLFDYKHLYERLVSQLEHCRKRDLPLSLVYVDIDYMKPINIEYGYKTGDSVLHQVKEILNKFTGDSGSVISSCSDKMILVLPGIDEGRVRVIVDDIARMAAAIKLPKAHNPQRAAFAGMGGKHSITKVTLSIGMVTWDKPEGIPANELLALLERALKTAKDDGVDAKIHYQFYSEPTRDGQHKIDKIDQH